jgi:hypothetical protein
VRGGAPHASSPVSRQETLPVGPLSVRIVLKDRGWIMEKIARRLVEHLPAYGIRADIADGPSADVDVNHYFIYSDFDIRTGPPTCSTLLITHIDRPAKLLALRINLRSVRMGVCISRMHREELIRSGIPPRKLHCINLGHDGRFLPRRLTIGMAAPLRPVQHEPDPLLASACGAVRMDGLHFEVSRSGWEAAVPLLREAGATVSLFDDGPEGLGARVASWDYYLNTGGRASSLGFFEAAAGGVPAIVPLSGFHLDARPAVTHPFEGAGQLAAVLAGIQSERSRRRAAVEGFQWREYAREHDFLWRCLLGERDPGPEQCPPSIRRAVPLEKIRSRYIRWRRRARTPVNRDAWENDVMLVLRSTAAGRLLLRVGGAARRALRPGGLA